MDPLVIDHVLVIDLLLANHTPKFDLLTVNYELCLPYQLDSYNSYLCTKGHIGGGG